MIRLLALVIVLTAPSQNGCCTTDSMRAALDRLHREDEATWVHVPSASPIPGSTVVSLYRSDRMNPVLGVQMPHYGIDLRAPTGTPVHAAGEGVVVGATYTATYGYAVDIDHGNNFVSRYAHLSRILVSKGMRVRRGDVIARSGQSGRAKGPNLHFEIYRDGWQTDPCHYLVYDLGPDGCPLGTGR